MVILVAGATASGWIGDHSGVFDGKCTMEVRHLFADIFLIQLLVLFQFPAPLSMTWAWQVFFHFFETISDKMALFMLSYSLTHCHLLFIVMFFFCELIVMAYLSFVYCNGFASCFCSRLWQHNWHAQRVATAWVRDHAQSSGVTPIQKVSQMNALRFVSLLFPGKIIKPSVNKKNQVNINIHKLLSEKKGPKCF